MAATDAVQSILTIALMIGTGYFLSYKKWFDRNASELFSRLILYVSLPVFMFWNILNTLSKENLVSSGRGLIIPLAGMILSYGIAVILAKLLKMEPERRGIFQAMFVFSNTVFIGLPVNLALFGDESVPLVLLYYIANTTLFWTIGIYSIRRSSREKAKTISVAETLRKIFSPPLMGFLVAIVFIVSEIRPPEFVMDTARYIGSMTTPLSMIFIGIIIYSIGPGKIRLSTDVTVLLIGRFLFCPLLVLGLSYYFSAPQLMTRVFVMEASMPVMAQSTIVAQAYEGDCEYAAVGFSVSTLVSMFVIPLYGILLSMI